MSDHDHSSLAIVRSSQERLSVTGGTNREGQGAVDHDLRGQHPTWDLEFGDPLQ